MKELIQKENRKLLFFLISIVSCGFLIAAEYAITRPASTGVFVSLFSAKAFPLAWIATVPLNLCVIYLYNRLLPKIGCLKTFLSIVSLVIVINTLCSIYIVSFPPLSFFQFLWKDIYILLMFKQIWSLIHATIDQKKAKYLYGILFSFGGVGSVIGGCIPSFFALKYGSQKLFIVTLPIYLLLSVSYYFALKYSALSKEQEQPSTTFNAPKAGFSLLKSSPYLIYLLLIVAIMQLSISLIDYQFNFYLENAMPTMDLRTQYVGRVVTITNGISTFLQLVGSFLFLHFMGLKRSHLFLPIYLGANALMLLFLPSFRIASYVYVSIKSLDYSVFGILREMLYLPMSKDEKFRAKSIIDVFGYRTAKAVGSLLLMGLQLFSFASSMQPIGILSIFFFILWFFFVFLLFKEKRKMESII